MTTSLPLTAEPNVGDERSPIQHCDLDLDVSDYVLTPIDGLGIEEATIKLAPLQAVAMNNAVQYQRLEGWRKINGTCRTRANKPIIIASKVAASRDAILEIIPIPAAICATPV